MTKGHSLCAVVPVIKQNTHKKIYSLIQCMCDNISYLFSPIVLFWNESGTKDILVPKASF